MRKTGPAHAATKTPYSVQPDGTWVVTGFTEVRQILRSSAVKQGGFGAERVEKLDNDIMQNPPILFLEGEEHHRMRRETNRFFTPTITDRAYRDFMDAYAKQLVGRLAVRKRLDLADLSMDMAVQVAARIVGLTSSLFPGGLKRRLEAMIDVGDTALAGEMRLLNAIKAQWSTLSFLLLDVMPAIRARRKQPGEDVISYLVERGYSRLEVLSECIVYGVAGMVTTREFIAVALWHLFEHPDLMERMKVGPEPERYAILHEILRLEPVVSRLYRRATADLTFESGDEQVTIPAGAKIELHIMAANADPHVMGPSPDALCPMRERADLKPKVADFGLSFGDGAHRCPGAYVAIQETDIFLRKLLDLPGLRIEREPDVDVFKIAESYEIRNFILAVD